MTTYPPDGASDVGPGLARYLLGVGERVRYVGDVGVAAAAIAQRVPGTGDMQQRHAERDHVVDLAGAPGGRRNRRSPWSIVELLGTQSRSSLLGTLRPVPFGAAVPQSDARATRA